MKNTIIYFFIVAITALSFMRCNTSAIASNQSEITCPECGYKRVETLPTTICLISYECEKCKKELFPKEGDCCVFCSYGSVKCPSMQEEK